MTPSANVAASVRQRLLNRARADCVETLTVGRLTSRDLDKLEHATGNINYILPT